MNQHAMAMAGCVALAGLATCSEKYEDPAPIRSVPKEEAVAHAKSFAPVVLVTIDGARWQDVLGAIDESASATDARMPVLRDIATTRGAAIGAPGFGRIDATGPNFVSMPGYTEIFTGRAPECANNECGSPREPTFADDLASRGASVAVFASWEKIARAVSNGSAQFPVSAGRQQDEPNDANDSAPRDAKRDAPPDMKSAAYDPYPGCGEYRPDAKTEDLVIAHLESHAPDVLVIDLGDTDEYAHRGDHNGYLRSLAEVDVFLDRLEKTLNRMGERGRETTLFLTSDHGRATNFRDHGGAFPESSRTWLVARGPLIVARGLVTTRDHHLADIAGPLRGVATGESDLRASALPELFAEPALTLR